METIDRFKGCLLGLAVGDAVGTSVEFESPGTFTPVTDMVGGGVFNLNPGEWTDDTSMALCMASSLIEQKGFNPKDQLEKYIQWKNDGFMSSNGWCFDIGNTVSSALRNFMVTQNEFPGLDDEWSAGNGSLMRLAPIPMYYANEPLRAIQNAGLSSKTTHKHIKAIDACRFYAGMIVGALQGISKDELLVKRYCPIYGYWDTNPLNIDIDAIACGTFKEQEPPDIKGLGYVVKSLEAALWAFHNSTCFKDGCLMAANLGDDADTTAAIYGQLAGAHYGIDSIPSGWLMKLAKKEIIEEISVSLYNESK
jgi:ADP-ribosylglycohydrolase